MGKGKEVDIPNEPGRPIIWRNQDVGWITGRAHDPPPPPNNITAWFH